MTPEQRSVDEHWMARALELAGVAERAGEVPVGAVIVRGDLLLGEGWNQPISSCDPSAHAEIMALRAAAVAERNYRLPGATLYVTIEPCTMCTGALVHSRIDRLVFAAAEPKAGAVISNLRILDHDHLNHRITYTSGVCEEQAIALIQAFFRRRRRETRASRRASPATDPKL